MIKFLIENGASIDIKNVDEETALHFAVKENQLEVVKCLVENGAIGTEKRVFGKPASSIITTNVKYLAFSLRISIIA